jgi:hypothetical protein
MTSQRERNLKATRKRIREAQERRRAAAEPRDIERTGDPRFMAALDLLARTGMDEFQIRQSDEGSPTAWLAVGRWGKHWDSTGAMNPVLAVFRLCDEMIDGGICQHCGRPSGFEPSMDSMPLAEHVCWYQWDPSTRTFARGCTGSRQGDDEGKDQG